jgi:hypothetical protein
VIANWLGEGEPRVIAGDIYLYFYPNMLNTLRSLAAGGSGLLWNPYQDCGQPFFATTGTALLYPLNAFFLLLPPETALRCLLFGNLFIGAVGLYALARELDVSRPAALGGGLAFVLGPSAFHLTTWEPTINIPYIWMPWAMWCCERLLKQPTLRDALLLGGVLGISLIAGHPQFVFFTCQLIALRLAWSVLVSTERRQLPWAVAAVALAVTLMVLLAAVQLFPGLEVAAESVRSLPLRPDEITPGAAQETWSGMALKIIQHNSLAPFVAVPAAIAAAAVAGRRHRSAALFYLIAAALFLIFSLGNATLLGRLYGAVPFVQVFRMPLRFVFVAGFCVSVLTAIAIDALAVGGWLAPTVSGIAGLAMYAWLGPIYRTDWICIGAVVAVSVLGKLTAVARPLAAVLIAGVVALAALLVPPWGIMGFIADDGPLRTHAQLFERLQQRLTPQDRVHLVPPRNDPGFQQKTATLFGFLSTTDYETQLTRRYAEYVTVLRTGETLRSINQVYYPSHLAPAQVGWQLMDLIAARYVVEPATEKEALSRADGRSIAQIDGDQGLRVYENVSALPRAYYLPRIAVVPSGRETLRRLAISDENRRQVGLVNEAPPSGFLGVEGNDATADAQFVVDDPERVVLDLVAPEQGFLFLADQYFPGWTASVNGQPAPILLANHAFRLVEVPRGPVRVEFVYQPWRVRIGAVISVATLVVVAAALAWTFRRPIALRAS